MKQIQPFQKHWLQIISIVVWRLNPITCRDICSHNGPLARYVKLLVAHAPGMPGTFSASLRISDPDIHHGTCVTHVPWCMPGSLTSGFLWSRWRGKRSRHFRRMRNQQFYVSGKRPMATNFRHRRTQSSWDQECSHYSDVIMNTMASQIIGISIVCSIFCSGVDEKQKHQSSASQAFVRGSHRWPVNSPHKRSVMRKIFPFDDAIMRPPELDEPDELPEILNHYNIYAKYRYGFNTYQYAKYRTEIDWRPKIAVNSRCRVFLSGPRTFRETH